MLKRCPMYLRVTEFAGKFDALDQPDDIPRSEEEIFAYQTTGPTGHMHVNMGSKGGWFGPMCSYSLCPVQPTDAQMRSNSEWRKWVYSVVPD